LGSNRRRRRWPGGDRRGTEGAGGPGVLGRAVLPVYGFPLGQRLLPGDGPPDAGRRAGAAIRFRRHSVRRGGRPEHSRPHHAARSPAAHAAGVRSGDLRPASVPVPGGDIAAGRQEGWRHRHGHLRENTEGEYAPVGGRLNVGTPHETVIQSNVFTRRGTERIIRAAFEHCVRRNKRMKSDVGHEIQRPVLRHGVLGRGVRGCGRRVPAGGDRVAAGGPGLHGLRALARGLRRRGGLQPVRRHTLRHCGGGDGQHGAGSQRQHQSRQGASVAVRAGAWRGL
ncbi:D-malate dehydrogenase [decarboxylating], partial [Geodia barretti]